MDEKMLFTLEEVATMTGFLLEPLKEDCRAGRVEHVHRGRKRLMTREQIEKLIESATRKASKTAGKPKTVTNAAGREVDVEAWRARKLASLARKTA